MTEKPTITRSLVRELPKRHMISELRFEPKRMRSPRWPWRHRIISDATNQNTLQSQLELLADYKAPSSSASLAIAVPYRASRSPGRATDFEVRSDAGTALLGIMTLIGGLYLLRECMLSVQHL